MNNLRIGLTMRVVEAQGYVEQRDALAHDWPRFMKQVLPEARWMPLPNVGKEVLDIVHAWNLNGFIITGGNDLHEYPARDETELALIEYALNENLPIFGVCRGFQIMAHYFGYKLKPCEGHAGTRHMISINGNEHTVNSYHRSCGPKEMKPPLEAFAKDMGARIEGFYHQGKPLKAVMWHPEREMSVEELDYKMIRMFFKL